MALEVVLETPERTRELTHTQAHPHTQTHPHTPEAPERTRELTHPDTPTPRHTHTHTHLRPLALEVPGSQGTGSRRPQKRGVGDFQK